MKKLLMIALTITSTSVFANDLNWQNSPLNWKNMDINYQNTDLDWKNSEYNWKNNELNYTQRNGIYNNAGDQAGYRSQNASGVTNYFDNDGARMGYSDE